MPADANAVLQASVTKTGTFNGAGMDLKGGTPRRGIFCRVVYSAASNASGSNAFTFSIDESSDNVTFFQKTNDAADVVTLSTTVQAGEIFLPIETSKRYIRLTVTQVGAGSTPTITYKGEIVASKP